MPAISCPYHGTPIAEGAACQDCIDGVYVQPGLFERLSSVVLSWVRTGVVVMVPTKPHHVDIISCHWFRWSARRRARAYARLGWRASVWDWRWPFYDRLPENGFLEEVQPPEGVRVKT